MNEHKEAEKPSTPEDRRQQALHRLALMRAAIRERRERPDGDDGKETTEGEQADPLEVFWKQR